MCFHNCFNNFFTQAFLSVLPQLKPSSISFIKISNPRQTKAAKWSWTGPWQSRRPVQDHLAAKGCLGFFILIIIPLWNNMIRFIPKIKICHFYNVTAAALQCPAKRCYPTFAIRIIIDKTGYLTAYSRQPKYTKWSLTGSHQSRGPANDHLAAFGYLGFLVR